MGLELPDSTRRYDKPSVSPAINTSPSAPTMNNWHISMQSMNMQVVFMFILPIFMHCIRVMSAQGCAQCGRYDLMGLAVL
jgi:hypothetical protein